MAGLHVPNKSHIRKAMMTNQDYINAYKSDEKIIADWYKMKDAKGRIVDLNGIVCPLKIDNRQLMAPTDN